MQQNRLSQSYWWVHIYRTCTQVQVLYTTAKVKAYQELNCIQSKQGWLNLLHDFLSSGCLIRIDNDTAVVSNFSTNCVHNFNLTILVIGNCCICRYTNSFLCLWAIRFNIEAFIFKRVCNLFFLFNLKLSVGFYRIQWYRNQTL